MECMIPHSSCIFVILGPPVFVNIQVRPPFFLWLLYPFHPEKLQGRLNPSMELFLFPWSVERSEPHLICCFLFDYSKFSSLHMLISLKYSFTNSFLPLLPGQLAYLTLFIPYVNHSSDIGSKHIFRTEEQILSLIESAQHQVK